MSQDGAEWRGKSLVVMLDWENFPGIRPNSQPLPLAPILEFLSAHFDSRVLLAYAHRSTLSAAWEERLLEFGFEMRLLDQLIDPNDKKNSLDLCLAMEAVRLSYTAAPDVYALLVAGDKDFAVVSAFIKQRLGRKIVAFGSLYCPNPALAATVDRYFLLEHVELWSAQLIGGTEPLPKRQPSRAKLKKAEALRPLVEAAVAELGPKTPMPLGLLTPAMRRFDPGFQTNGRIKLSAVMELLDCELSEDRQSVERWSTEILAGARVQAGWPEGVAWSGRHVTDWPQYQALVDCVCTGLAALAATLRFPLPLSVLQTAIQKRCPEFRSRLGKRVRLWHVLEDMGFGLTDDHKAVLNAHHGASELAGLIEAAMAVEPAEPQDDHVHLVVQAERLPLEPEGDSPFPFVPARQLVLFEPPRESYEALFEERRSERVQAVRLKQQGIPRAADALHRRVQAEEAALPPGPLFARLSGKPRQKPLPFKDRRGGM